MSLRKNEILSTIAEAYFNLIHSKLKFSIVQEESLKAYVTLKKQKIENMEFTLMRNDVNYIEDIIPKENSEEEIETPEKDEDKNKLENNENEEDNLGKKMSEIVEKDKYDFNLDRDKNPFTAVLIGGGVATGAGIGATVIGFDSLILGIGMTFFSGIAMTGVGLVVAVPSLIGFGAYKIYKNVKDKDKKKFFESFNLEKMKIEKEFQKYVICKMDNYFNKRIIIENTDEIEKYINDIIDIYISIDNQIIESKLDLGKNELLDKIKKDGKIVAMNISKIKEELMKTILGNIDKKYVNIFNKGIPLFKEFIKNFGPRTIDEIDEKATENIIIKIIDLMKEILEQKMKVAFNKFENKHFINAFDLKLEDLYEEKKKLDNISKKDFINNCKNFIVEPIANNSQNYGVLSLFFKFTLIIQKICAKKKADNFNLMKEKIINHNNQNNNQNYNQNNNQNQNNFIVINPTFSPEINQNNQIIQQSKPMNIIQETMDQNLALNQNMEDNAAPLYQGMLEIPKPLNKSMLNKNNENLNQNINIEFIFNNKKIVIQGTLNMTADELIEKFKIVLNDNIIINKYLINDEMELDPSSKKTLKELGITSDIKIMIS